MDAEIGEYNYSIRWIFEDSKKHELDAKTLLKSEQNLADFLYEITNQFGLSIEIRALARDKGSFKSEFKILWKKNLDKIFIAGITSIISISLTAFFQQVQEPKSTTLDREKLVLDLQEKINKGDLTLEQAQTYIEEFSSLAKYKNAFFKANKIDKEISEIEITQEGKVTSNIGSGEFDNYISNNQTSETVIYDAKVYIISPVLVAGVTEKWTGEYEGDKIRFSVKDKDFLEKSQNKVISFNTGFFIRCKLRKIDKSIAGKEQCAWEVLEVTHYAVDDEHVVEFEHRIKSKNKEISGQMTLFD